MPVRIQCTAPLHSRQNHETPKGSTGGGRQLSHSCAQNISGRSRFCICTRYCTQLLTQEVQLQVPGVNKVLLLVGERVHHPQGADGRRNLHMEVSGTLSVHSGIIFPLNGMGVSESWDLGEVERAKSKGTNERNKVTCHTHHA